MSSLRRWWLLAVLVALAPQGARAAGPAQRRQKVAVAEMKPLGTVEAKEIEGLTGMVAAGVNDLKRFEVITRSDIQTLLGLEKEKQLLGCTDASCLAELGGALGVDFIVASEVSRIGSSWLLSLSLVDVKRARSVNRASTEAPSSDALLSALRRGVRELFGELVAAQVPPPAVAGRAAEEPSAAGSYLRYGGGAVGLLGGGALYASGWLTYDEFEQPGGAPTVSMADADRARLRSGVGLGLAAAGAALLLWELLTPAPEALAPGGPAPAPALATGVQAPAAAR